MGHIKIELRDWTKCQNLQFKRGATQLHKKLQQQVSIFKPYMKESWQHYTFIIDFNEEMKLPLYIYIKIEI